MVLSSSSTYAADLASFKDAPQVGSRAYDSLNYAVEKGYLVGIDGELKADKTLSRAELAAILVRAYGKDAVASNLSQFKDVKKDAWYYEDLAKAYSKGYIKGKSTSMMAPNETVSQLEALVIIARASGHIDGRQEDVTGINEKVPTWAVSNIGSLVKTGIIKANSQGELNLGAKMTRGNFAEVIYQIEKRIASKSQEEHAKNAKKGDTNNPLDENGKNPYLPAPGSSSSGSTTSSSQSLTWYYGDANVDQRYYPSNTGDAFIHPPFFNAHIGIGVDENGIIREIVDNDTARRSGNEAFWNNKQKSYWVISKKKFNNFIGKNLEQVKAMRMGHGGADIVSGATSNGLALQEAIINALEKKNTDKEAILGKKVLPNGAKLTAQTPVTLGNDTKISFTSSLPTDFDIRLHSVRYGSTNEEVLADSDYTWDSTSKTLTLKSPKAGKYFVNIVDASGKWRSPNFESGGGINYPYTIVEASTSNKVMSFNTNHQLQTAAGQMDNIYKNIDEVLVTELDRDGNVVMVERTNRQGQKVTVPNTVEIEPYGHHGNINTSFDIISPTGQLNLNATNRGKKIFEDNKRFRVEVKIHGYGEVQTEVNNLPNPPSPQPQPQTKADQFKAEMGNIPTLKTSIETDKLVLEAEEKSKITADRVAKALDTEGKRPTYGYIDVSIKTNVDRSSIGEKEAVATLKFNDNSELEVKIPVEVEGLPVVYLHPSIKLSSALSGREYEVGENLDLNGMKVLVPFAKELKADGTWDAAAAAQLVYVEYKDLGVADIKVVKKGTTTEFVNNSPITADMIEDGKIALEVYKENIVSTDSEAKNRQAIKGLKAKATVPNPPAPGGNTNPLFGDIDGKNILSKEQVEAISQNLHFEDGEYFGDAVGFVESKPLPVKITVTNGKVVAVDIVREEIGKIWPGSYSGDTVDDGGRFEASCIRAFNLVASKGKDPVILAYQMKAARDLTRQVLAVSSDTGKEISEALIDVVGKDKFGANNTITVSSHYDTPSDAEDDVMRCMKTYLTTEYGYEQYAFDTISGATFSGSGGAIAIGNALKKATADSDIKDFRVKTFATDKRYMVGDEADWSDVVVTVTKKDGSTVDVPYAQFSEYGLSIVIKADKGYHQYLPFPQGEHFEKVGAIYPRVYHQASETYKFLKAMNVTAKRKIMKGEKIQIKVKGTDNWIDLLDYQTDEYVQRLKVPTTEVSNIDGKEVEFREVAKDIRSGEVKEFSLKLASTPDASILAKVDGTEQYEVVIPQNELKVTPPYSISPNNHRIILSAE